MRFRHLEEYRRGGTGNHMNLAVPVPKTPEGRVYRYSPNEAAHPRHFVLGDRVAGFAPAEDRHARMKQAPGSPQTVCPYSGIIAPDADFIHPDDIEAATELVKHAALEDVQEQLSNMFADLARSTRSNRFITIEHRSNHRPQPKPRFGRRDLMRALVCDHCGRDYGVFAIALFCPDCGAPNVRLHFAREVELVGKQVELAEAQGAEDEELAYRLLGNAHEDVLTAFEATLKTVHRYATQQRNESGPSARPVLNDFQNIEKTRSRFAPFAFDPFSSLSEDELKVLAVNIQKRHVVGHNLGVVDEKFAQVAIDAKLGETVGLVGTDVRAFAAVSQKVVDALDNWIAPTGSPGIASNEAPSLIAAAIDALPTEEPQLPEQLALWFCQQSDDGMADWMTGPISLREAFHDQTVADLEMALAELQLDGLVTLRSLPGSGELPLVRPELELFVQYDPKVHDWNPTTDAVELIGRVLTGPESVNVAQLHAETGWSRRRFNPALALILPLVGEGRVSQALQDEYPTTYFALLPEDRVALKRFAKRITG